MYLSAWSAIDVVAQIIHAFADGLPRGFLNDPPALGLAVWWRDPRPRLGPKTFCRLSAQPFPAQALVPRLP